MQHCRVQVTEAQENHLPLHGMVLFIGDGGTAQEEGWHEPLICISSSRPVWQREKASINLAGRWQTYGRSVVRNAPYGSIDGAPRCEPAPCRQCSCIITGKRCNLNRSSSTEMLSAHAQLLAQHLSMDRDREGKKKKKARIRKTETAVLQGIYFSKESRCELYTAEMNFAVTGEHLDN